MKKARWEINCSFRNSITKIVPAGTFLSEDIMIAMFACLPLISIYKLRSVSKVWLSMLSDPYFIAKWCNYNNTNKSLLWMQYHPRDLKHYACPSSYSQFLSRHDDGFSFRFLMQCKKIQETYFLHFVGSSNGLVLCYTEGNYIRRYCVCNPLTQKWVSFPSQTIAPHRHVGVIGFFWEYASPHNTSSYKVVCILNFDGKFCADIFCSNLGKWKMVEVSCPDNVSLVGYNDNAVTHHGVLYWINEGRSIVAYNLNNHGTNGYQCSFIDLPDGFCPCPQIRALGESEGVICYATIHRSERTLRGWVLKEDNWQLLYEGVELHEILIAMDNRKPCTSHTLCSANRVQLVGFNPVDHHVVLLSCWDYIWEFNIRTRRFEELRYPSSFLNIFTRYDFWEIKKPFVLKPMPTIIPPPSWIDTSDFCV